MHIVMNKESEGCLGTTNYSIKQMWRISMDTPKDSHTLFMQMQEGTP